MDAIKHATCTDCHREMTPGTPCKYTHIKIAGRWYRRDTTNFCSPGICSDCNSPHGSPHHFGCDNERCPKCGGQIISCDCFPEDQPIELATGDPS